MENAEKERKQILSFCFVPTQRVIENSKKNSKKIQKNLKIPLWLHFKPEHVGKGRERERKYILSFHFVPTHHLIENSKKIAKKFKKLNNTIMAPFRAKIG